MSTPQMTVDGLVAELQKGDLETADRLQMFVSLCNADKLVKELKHHALMQSMDMAIESDVHAFAYGVLKLSHPHLFEEK